MRFRVTTNSHSMQVYVARYAIETNCLWRIILLQFALWLSPLTPAASIWIDELDLANVEQGWGSAKGPVSVEGKPLTISGRVFTHGIGTHAPGEMAINLHGTAKRFESVAGIDSETQGKGRVVFKIFGDGRKLFDSGFVNGTNQGIPVAVDLTSIRILQLSVTTGGDSYQFDHADWGDGKISFEGATLPATLPLFKTDGFLTPAPPRSDLLASIDAKDLTRPDDGVGHLSAACLHGYYVVSVDATSLRVKTYTGNEPANLVAKRMPAQFQAGDLIIAKAEPPNVAQIRILDQPTVANGFRASVEINAAVACSNLTVSLFRLPSKVLVGRFIDQSSQRVHPAAAALERETQTDLKTAGQLWEEAALSTDTEIVRRFAMERALALVASRGEQANRSESPKVTAIINSLKASGIEAEALYGPHVIWIIPKEKGPEPSIRRAFAELNLAYAVLRDLSGKDSNTQLRERLIIQYSADKSLSGAVYGSHGISLGGRGPSIPFEGRAGIYHEIAHDVIHGPNLLNPVAGFGEGWATFAVIPIFDCLGFDEWSDLLRERFREAYRDAVDRRTKIDHLPGYDVSAGFLTLISDSLVVNRNWRLVREWLHESRRSPEPNGAALQVDAFREILCANGRRRIVDPEVLQALNL